MMSTRKRMSRLKKWMCTSVVAGAMFALAGPASAALFSFEATETNPTTAFNYAGTTLTGSTDVPLTIQISGVNTTVDSHLSFTATRTGVETYASPAGSFDVWVFDGSFEFTTTTTSETIMSGTFTEARTITSSGVPISGIQASSAAPGDMDYTPGSAFKSIAGAVLGFDPLDPTISLELTDPQSMGFTLTGVLPTGANGQFDANSSFSGNAEITVTVVPEPASMALLMLGGLVIGCRDPRKRH